MANYVYRPNAAGRRRSSVIREPELSRERPLKRLLVAGKQHAGRNAAGRITVRHRGGGARKRLRVVDFNQSRFEVPARIQRLEYDPGRHARLALVAYRDGDRRYHLAAAGQRVGDAVVTSARAYVDGIGNRFPLKLIPTGTSVFNVELAPQRGGRLARGAGTSVVLAALDAGFAQIKLPSGEVRRVAEDCLATVGQASNADWRNVRWGKAGRIRHRGIRPTVRGKVMNPVDHPHGGGEGKNSIGLKHPKTPWGKPALGVKTRRVGRPSDRLIVQRRRRRSR
jgi:large subunit ribosomal protein L2